MRIKFEKGMPPERIADMFVKFVRQNDLVIGSVNMYIQLYDDEMKAEKFDKSDYYTCIPSEKTKSEYAEYVAQIRRKRMKVV